MPSTNRLGICRVCFAFMFYFMKKIFFPLLLTAALLTGCADGSRGIEALTEKSSFAAFSEESASDITVESGSDALPIELPEFVTVYHEDNLDENGNPVLENRPDGYYAYNGRRYWLDLECAMGHYIEENGSYALIPDAFGELTPEDQLSGIDKIMYYFDTDDYLYLGCSEKDNPGFDNFRRDFYVHNDGKYILCLDKYDELAYQVSPEMLGEGRCVILASVWTASKI